ncbi:hypothetical protein [Bacillus sp. FSL K6-3431]|uniref:hypothetical protein n=1 Tax=Bacillus sp. FSL K6-3431 TaxID=2921500 RepID=UPI0030F86F31
MKWTHTGVSRAGHGPLKLIEKYKGRLVLLLQKDFPKEALQPTVMYEDVFMIQYLKIQEVHNALLK